MRPLGKFVGFEWDKRNVDNSYQKHGITVNEAEEVFIDESLIINKDVKHSTGESRNLALGKTRDGKILIVTYTTRKDKIRIISARVASKKERKYYENQV